MPSKEHLKKKAISQEKKEAIRAWLSDEPKLSNEDLVSSLKEHFGSSMENKHFTTARRELGIATRKPRKTRNKKITNEDVLLLQKDTYDIPKDIKEILQFIIQYMREAGIKSMELKEDGSTKLKLIKEIETVV